MSWKEPVNLSGKEYQRYHSSATFTLDFFLKALSPRNCDMTKGFCNNVPNDRICLCERVEFETDHTTFWVSTSVSLNLVLVPFF